MPLRLVDERAAIRASIHSLEASELHRNLDDLNICACPVGGMLRWAQQIRAQKALSIRYHRTAAWVDPAGTGVSMARTSTTRHPTSELPSLALAHGQRSRRL